MPNPIVVIGAGQAAASFISRHVALGNRHPVLLIGDEPVPPYQRPPLSKKYMSGETGLERLFIRPAGWYAEQNVVTRFHTRVTHIKRDRQQIETESGDRFDYHKLILCTGSSPRQLNADIGGALSGVFTLRNIADAEAIATEFRPGRKLLIVGGGYIGLEAAAVARKFGLEVSLLEITERILQRVAAPQTSDFFRLLHQKNGVEIHESTRLLRLNQTDRRVSSAELDNGETLPVDLVLVGIGSIPRADLAERAGLDCDQGILVNNTCQTSDPDIYAAGDCTRFMRNGQYITLESVQNASDQGDLIARLLNGEETSYNPQPWFWSDQYDCKLQIAGLSTGYTRTVLRPGAKPEGQSVWYYAQEQLLAVDAMNDPLAYAMARKIISKGLHPNPHQIADLDFDLKSVIQ